MSMRRKSRSSSGRLRANAAIGAASAGIIRRSTIGVPSLSWTVRGRARAGDVGASLMGRRSIEAMDVLVETRRGRVRGLAEEGLAVFRGIPYARPPVGPRRFGPPEPPDAWTGTHDAPRFGPPAPQTGALIAPILRLALRLPTQ